MKVLNDPISVEFMEIEKELMQIRVEDHFVTHLFTDYLQVLGSVIIKDTTTFKGKNIFVFNDSSIAANSRNGKILLKSDVVKTERGYIYLRDFVNLPARLDSFSRVNTEKFKFEFNNTVHEIIKIDTLISNLKFNTNKRTVESFRRYLIDRKKVIQYVLDSDSTFSSITDKINMENYFNYVIECQISNLLFKDEIIDRWKFITKYSSLLFFYLPRSKYETGQHEA